MSENWPKMTSECVEKQQNLSKNFHRNGQSLENLSKITGKCWKSSENWSEYKENQKLLLKIS